MSREPQTPPTEPCSPAERFVALDAATDDARTAAWVDDSAGDDDALARCAAAVAIARGLADDPELRWAYEEAAALARGDVRGRAVRVRRRTLLAWSGAGLAAAAVAAAALVFSPRAPRQPSDEPLTSRAAEIVAMALPVAPVVMLQGGIAVDANSVAVLRFATIEAAGDETAGAQTAARLERAVFADLATVPGVYVLGGTAVEPYAGADFSAAEVGALLGTRGILSGQVEQSGAAVHVHAQLADAATNQVVWRADYDATAGELRSVSTELVDGVVTALVDPALRETALRSSGAPSAARTDHALASIVEPAFDR